MQLYPHPNDHVLEILCLHGLNLSHVLGYAMRRKVWGGGGADFELEETCWGLGYIIIITFTDLLGR